VVPLPQLPGRGRWAVCTNWDLASCRMETSQKTGELDLLPLSLPFPNSPFCFPGFSLFPPQGLAFFFLLSLSPSLAPKNLCPLWGKSKITWGIPYSSVPLYSPVIISLELAKMGPKSRLHSLLAGVSLPTSSTPGHQVSPPLRPCSLPCGLFW
jgi:hypothetical protein